MAKSIIWLGTITFILVAMLLGGTQVLAQTGDSASDDLRYFAATGHNVAGEFLVAYDSATNPLLIYGNPITEAFEDPSNGNRFIQYFERARFELHPNNPPELRIVITPLGFLLHESSPPSLASPGSIPGCRFYPEVRFHVCYDFLEFYLANGGAAQFGYPISNFEIHNGRVVQDFQRARFEWHPEQPRGEKVQLTDLGKQYFILMSENPVRLLPVKPTINPLAPMSYVEELNVRAFFEKSIKRSEGEQTLFITVQDQRNMPVPEVSIEVEVLMPSGKSYRVELEDPTDKNGIARYDNFPTENEAPGMVKVKVTASSGELTDETTISYLIWW